VSSSRQGDFAIEAGQLVAGYYRLVEYIGAGAMGVVWRAVDERLERSVAVKKVVGQHGLSPADRAELHARAMREAKNAARLQHPNAIMVFDITEHEGDPCLVMEYLPSKSLSQLIAERGTLPVPEVARIGEQVAAALQAAHEAGIVHRDVKPGNILIDDAGVAKLTDFGISRAQGDMTLTATGLVGGTPAYLAPELARGADPAPASDVFALGATLYHAIEGHCPYGDNPNQLALLHTAASGKVRPPMQAGKATALLMSMLRPEASERIGMAEAARRLAQVAASAGAPDTPAATMPALPPTGPVPSQPAAEQRSSWHRSRGSQRQGTAVFDAVEHQPAPPRNDKPKDPQRGKSGNAKLIAGLLAFIAVIAVGLVLLLNNDGEDPQAAGPPPSSQTAEKPPPSSKPKQGGHDKSGGPIQFGDAGNLVVDFYTFPKGMAASWQMLSEEAKQEYGSEDEFRKYWSQYDQVWSNDAVGKQNADGSVTITIQVTFLTDGTERTEQHQVRVIRQDGELRVDSGTR
jgi:serine/threonine protein kinase